MTGESTLDHGKITICMESGYINMQMESFMRANMKTTKRQATEFINGLMGEYMRGIGTRESNMVLEFSRTQIKKR